MQPSNTLKEAINASRIIPKKQKAVLQTICVRTYPTSAIEIEESLGLSRPAVNFSLQMLLKRNFIKRAKDGVFLYTPNEERIAEVLERYKCK
jgi:predicted transcriptional regulator